MDKQQLTEAVSQVLDYAKQLGATEAEASVLASDGFSANVRMGEVDTVEYQRDNEMNVTVYVGKSKGCASTTDTRSESIKTTTKAAFEIAKATEEDPYNGLAAKELMYQGNLDLQLFFPWEITAEQGIDLALQCESYARSLDQRITNSDGVAVETYQSTAVVGNSNGLLQCMEASRYDLSCVLIAEQNGAMERDYSYTLARDPKDLLNHELLAKQAVEKTVSRLGSQKIKTCKAPVIFKAEMARSLLGEFASAISGGRLYKKASFLVDALGKPVFSDFVHLYEDPLLAKAMGSTPFDGDGLATKKKDFVRDGILQSYCLSTYSARQLGMESTANAGGIYNLIMQPGEGDLAALIRQMDKGLLVTEMMGHGVNLVTGDYSQGVSGFWVESGEIQFPVSEITIAGNLRDMFRQIVAAGNDVDYRGGVRTGSLLIEQMTIAGS
jgi:PmbA protein